MYARSRSPRWAVGQLTLTASGLPAASAPRLASPSKVLLTCTAPLDTRARPADQCAKCSHVFNVECDFEQRNEMKMPSECPSEGLTAKACGSNKFDVIPGSEICRDYQEVRIQEQVHKLTVGSIPPSITLVLHDDLVDRCKPGDDVTVVGVLRKRWRPLMRDQRPDIELAITAEHVRVRNEERGADRVSTELALEFADFWKRHAGCPLTALRIAAGEGRGEPEANIGIINARGRCRAEIENVMASLAQPGDERRLQRNGGVIGSDGDSHEGQRCSRW